MFKLILTGNVGRTPDIKATKTNELIATFSVAVKLNKDTTEWVDVVCGGKLVDVVKNYVVAGSKILVEGKPTAKHWLDKNNGNSMGKLSVFANQIELLGSKIDNNSEENAPAEPELTEEVPF